MKTKCWLSKCKMKPLEEVVVKDLQLKVLILEMILIMMLDKLMKLKKNS